MTYTTRIAERRKLRIYATDPMSGRRAPYRITIDVENEHELQPGPSGETLEVVDYDGWNSVYYAPVDLNKPALLMEAGLPHSESDPRFHQQMVYAVAMRVVEHARKAIGRPIYFGGRAGKKLRLFPHAFFGRNSFFDPAEHAIFFGYFQADSESPGQNIPGQVVFSCLSHDIIAHEMTHAIVHRLRRRFLEPSNLDVLAFHEAFADIVALFLRFSYRELLLEHIQASHSDLRRADMLVELAQQFGQATGMGKALRSALGVPPAEVDLARAEEPHDRGAILVSAVFDGYFRAYQKRTEDLIRIATGGSGNLSRGRLHPDLVGRLAAEASELADRFLRICFRAFDYMPPVDVTFGDFLRALVTSDFEANPDDPGEVRYGIIEGFRERGIYPAGVTSLAEESLLWPNQIGAARPADFDADILEDAWRLVRSNVSEQNQRRLRRRDPERADGWHRAVAEYQAESTDDEIDTEEAAAAASSRFAKLHRYATANAVALGLDPSRTIAVEGFHTVYRSTVDQRTVVEFVAQFTQTDRNTGEDLGGLPLRGGSTVIFDNYGKPRYIACKPMPGEGVTPELHREGTARLARMTRTVEAFDRRDPLMAFADPEYLKKRMALRARFRAVHGE